MALAHVQTVQKADAASGTTVAADAITTTSGNLVVLVALNFATSKFFSVSDSLGNVWVPVPGSPVQVDSRAQSCRMYFAKNIIGGADHIFTLNNSSADFCTLFAMEISGADISSPFDVTAKQSQSSTAAPSSGATVERAQAAEILIGAWASRGTLNTTATAGSGFTIPTNGFQASKDAGMPGAIEYRIVSSVGTDDANFNLDTTDDGGTIVATFAPMPTASPARYFSHPTRH